MLVGGFAVAALVLSVVGIYGVMAYFIQQHRRDIGIRLALGGEPSDVRRMVVLQGLRLVVVGVAVGVGVALLTARFLTTLLFDCEPDGSAHDGRRTRCARGDCGPRVPGARSPGRESRSGRDSARELIRQRGFHPRGK